MVEERWVKVYGKLQYLAMTDEALIEVEEQVDLDGDNDIEEMLDDEVEDPTEDDDYNKEDLSPQFPPTSEGEDHESNRDRPKFSQPEQGYGNPRASSITDETATPNKEEESEKHAELLALPPHGSEVFVGGIPRETNKENLMELFEPFGEIFEVRLMKDEKMENKGYAFITYVSKDSAQRAIDEIHNKEFKGKTLRCSQSQVKHRLFIGNIPKNMTEEEIKAALEECGPGIQKIEFHKDPGNPDRNRGYVFVEYYNNACAEYSRQKMSRGSYRLEGAKLTVNWADAKNSSDSPASLQVKAVYVKNLPESTSAEKLKEIFECHGEITKVVLPPLKPGQTKKGFGFIHFAERSSALNAVKATEKYEIDGHVIEATLAKPLSERKLDHSVNASKPALLPSYSPYPSYGYGGYGASMGYGQPMIYGRGPMPPGMTMVPMMLPDGRVGYVLQQPGMQPHAAPPPARRSDRNSGYSDGGSRYNDGRSRYSDGGGRYSDGGSRYGDSGSRYGDSGSRYGDSGSRSADRSRRYRPY